jgi:RimJ/RimL family protein N-acetyltransferase
MWDARRAKARTSRLRMQDETVTSAASLTSVHAMPSPSPIIDTPRLRLVLESTAAVLARIDAMDPADRAEVSPEWLARMRNSPPSPWTHGFAVMDRKTNAVVGMCAFKGPPDADGIVEIAYGIEPPHRGRGYAKEAAGALTEFAVRAGARRITAHTLPDNSASARVLKHCGFEYVGEVVDPEDGLVWRWELVGTGRADA